PIGQKPRPRDQRRLQPAAVRAPARQPIRRSREATTTTETEVDVQVAGRREVADGVVELTLSDPTGAPLPSWTAGAH
ncbi:hypothetical protein PJI23_34255, partial [Mycobacterium kansasii]